MAIIRRSFYPDEATWRATVERALKATGARVVWAEDQAVLWAGKKK